MEPVLMSKSVMIIDNEGDKNRENGEAKAPSMCVVSSLHMLGVLSFIMKGLLVFFVYRVKLDLLAILFLDLL